MRLVLIADVFPPLRSSGAVQLRDLAAEMVRQGHDVTVLVASSDLLEPYSIEERDGARVVRLRTPRTRDTGYLRRTFGELLMPFVMRWRLRQSPLQAERWEGVVWYSPTIFLGPIAGALRRRSGCRGYLIIRDIFPEWAVDMGLMGRGLPYWFLRAMAGWQYSVADVIGVQTPGNRVYFSKWSRGSGRRLEVLHNWLAEAAPGRCSICLSESPIAGRKILVYAGNMGVAQGMDVLIDVAERLHEQRHVGFAFVGRGSAVPDLKEQVRCRQLENVVFFDEIDPDEIPGLYAQCHVGLVALDRRHRTHNIPGKFLSYMQAGLPVLATVNPGNDLVGLIRDSDVGRVSSDASPQGLAENALSLLQQLDEDSECAGRCRALSARLFSVEVAAVQIVSGLSQAGGA
jgi:glycosyltransferase involved in cell wall biosynthesis